MAQTEQSGTEGHEAYLLPGDASPLPASVRGVRKAGLSGRKVWPGS